MFDIGWPELMVVAILTVLVVGPSEIPRVLRTVMGLVRKVRMMAGEFQNSMEDIAREADLADIKKQISETNKKNIEEEIEKAVDPTGDVTKSVGDMENELDRWKREGNIAPGNSVTPPPETTAESQPDHSETAEAEAQDDDAAATDAQVEDASTETPEPANNEEQQKQAKSS